MKYRLVFIASYINLLWEKFWNRFWAAICVTVVFAALALLNVPMVFGLAGHMLLLAGYAVAMAVVLLRSPHSFSLPSRDEVERRIEQASALEHRPLQALRDTPADGALSLWHEHKHRAAAALSLLKVYTPKPDVARRDRWYLRYVALAFLVIGVAVAQNDSGARIYQAITPDMSSLVGKQIISVDLWITPPEYTHEATIYLATSKQGVVAHDKPLVISAGSVLKLRLSGLHFAPRLSLGEQKFDVSEVSPRNYTFDLPLQQSGTLVLGSWLNTLGQWPLTVVGDTAPTVDISKIEPTSRATTKITYKATDDHGIKKLTGLLAVDGNSYSFDMPPTNSAEETTYTQDLTSNPSAGETASLWLEAEDAVGHKTDSKPVSFILPERQFTNPTAQKIISQRKILLHEKSILVHKAVANTLSEIVNQPSLYKGNMIVFMALASAVKRLVYDNTDEGATSTAELLWNVAMKIEDSGLTLSQRELSDSLQKLSEALKDKNLTKAQMQDMLDEVKKKMQQYIQTLAQELQQKLRDGQKTPALSPELANKFMKNLNVNKLLEQMRELNQASSREDLQKLADSLKNSIDNLDLSKFNQMQEKQAQAMQQLQNLQDIIHRQQSLLDKTNKAAEAADVKELQPEQAAIRSELGDSLHKLADTGAEIPDNFATADQAMKASAEALGQSLAQKSMPLQKTALDELQKGVDKAVAKMAESMQASLLSFGSGGEQGFGEGFDPLGRSTGKIDDGTVKIPEEKERRRVQEIIEELRHRSNEPTRQKAERDYIDRLLDQF